MNELLQKHGCSNVFHVPEGLRELMADISREVLRAQPKHLLGFITNYLSVLLITREHGIMTVKILDDLCDCKPSINDHLAEIGLDIEQCQDLSHIIQEEIASAQPVEGGDKLREVHIMKRILLRHPLDEEYSAKVIQVIRNAYRDYWYRKKVMEQAVKMRPEEPWQIAANNTLELYKKTNPSMAELQRATLRIQAAYRGYHTRRKLLDHLKKPKSKGPKIGMGPPLDIAESREIDLGPVLNIKIQEDNVNRMFEARAVIQPSVKYTPAPPLQVPEEDAETKDIMSARTEDNQTLSHYKVPVDDYEDDEYGADAGGHRISFAAKPLTFGTSETSEIPEAITVLRPDSPASTVPSSTPAGDVTDADEVDDQYDDVENATEH